MSPRDDSMINAYLFAYAHVCCHHRNRVDDLDQQQMREIEERQAARQPLLPIQANGSTAINEHKQMGMGPQTGRKTIRYTPLMDKIALDISKSFPSWRE